MLKALILTSVLAPPWLWAAAPDQRVAYDDAGNDAKQPHLVTGSNWKFDNPGDATADARTAVFDATVEFGYAGLKPQAAYCAKMRFFTDAPRTMRVMAGESVLVESLAVETGKTLERTIAIPHAAYAKGNLNLVFKSLSGPNAAVSAIEILSDDPTPLAALAEPVLADQELPAELHRLSPAPLVPVPADPACVISLNGEWRFNPEPPAGFWTSATADRQLWKPIQVPGEWALQGFSVKPNAYAAYRHTFQLPAGWAGRRVILRFDAVHSACRLYLNGHAIGEHVGAFLPFEFDLTKFVQPGENRLDLAVCNDSVAESLAKGNHYAQHPIGGILRKVRVFRVPQVHAASLDLRTDLSPDLREGSISLALRITNRSNTKVTPAVSARLVPLGILGISLESAAAVPVELGSTRLPAMVSGDAAPAEFAVKLPTPQLWHAESPFLYRVEITLTVDGKPVETLVKNCGFRRVEVIDRRLTINGHIAKLKGVCRHSVHPTLGRALTPDLIRRDAELFKAANCNLIRTSHYPAEEEFIDLCDQLGLFVMDEAPFCWVNLPRNVPPADAAFIQQTQLALLDRDRHHPSVIIWSLANESMWSTVFETSARLVKLADPTRLAFFSHSEYYGTKGKGLLDIGTRHYPGWHSLLACSQYFRPIIYDEWAHLNAYNEREILTDPAVRDLWGEPVDRMWHEIVNSRNAAGVAIWGGIDEKFFVGDQPVGYGPWGIIDGWRREKPEYWHTQKAFSPVHFPLAELHVAGTRVAVPLTNCYETMSLSHLRFQWSCGAAHGEVRPAIPPQNSGGLEIDLAKPPAANAELLISVIDPRGVLVDRHLVTLNPAPLALPEAPPTARLTCAATAGGWLVTTPSARISVSRATGLFAVTAPDGKTLVERAPHLMILPSDNSKVRVVNGIPIPLAGHENDGSSLFSPVCTNWQPESVTLVAQSAQRAEFLVKGQYAEAGGEFTYHFTPGGCRVDVFFNPKVNCSPRQVGIVFDLPARFQTLSWKRKGYWSWYPDSHIGRLQGTAVACPRPLLPDLNGPRQAPAWNWLEDTVVFGSNDFRATKHNIHFTQLTDSGRNRVRVNSDGSQHTRCWLENDRTRLLVATHSVQGAEHYFSYMSGRDRISYNTGEFREERVICNSVKLQFNPLDTSI